jgi:hypothetical protein
MPGLPPEDLTWDDLLGPGGDPPTSGPGWHGRSAGRMPMSPASPPSPAPTYPLSAIS